MSMNSWPMHADGQPKRIGGMCEAERRGVFADAARRTAEWFQQPGVVAQIVQIIEAAEILVMDDDTFMAHMLECAVHRKPVTGKDVNRLIALYGGPTRVAEDWSGTLEDYNVRWAIDRVLRQRRP